MSLPRELNLAYLNVLTSTQTPESFGLEFKASEVLISARDKRAPDNVSKKTKAEMRKDVSGMANADGGLIVYGIVESSSRADRIDDGCPISDRMSEFIEQTCSTIIPRISGLRIHALMLENGTHEVFIVEVPKATSLAPHQADFVYYQRHNTEVLKLADYQIRDLMKRSETPDVFLTVQALNKSIQKNDDSSHAFSFQLRIIIDNAADSPAESCSLQFHVDNQLSFLAPEWVHTSIESAIPIQFSNGSGAKVEAAVYNRNLLIVNHIPIFKGCMFAVLDTKATYLISGSAAEAQLANNGIMYLWTVKTPYAKERVEIGSIPVVSDI